MIDAAKRAELDKLRRHGIGRLLFMTRRDFMARLSVKMATRVDTSLLVKGGALLPFIDLDGTRSTELARRLGISKQAVGKSIRALEDAGFLKRVDDAADGRAYLISFTESGVDYLLEMHRAIAAVEREYDVDVGADRMNIVRAALGRIAYGDEVEHR